MIGQIMHLMHASQGQCYHWSTHSGAALDLLVTDGSRRYGFEVKRAEAPRLTPSMKSAMETLKLDRLDIVHAGAKRYQLAPGVQALPAPELESLLPTLAQGLHSYA